MLGQLWKTTFEEGRLDANGDHSWVSPLMTSVVLAASGPVSHAFDESQQGVTIVTGPHNQVIRRSGHGKHRLI